MTLAVCGDYYDESDERMIRVIGKNNAWMTKFFDVAYLEKDYDIRIQNSSALPRSLAARTQTLLDLNERFPDQFTSEQVIDLLDLGQSDKFIDSATVAVKTAQAENEELLKDTQDALSEEQLAPKEFENHILHWREHTRMVQEYSFKYQTPEAVQERMINHIMAHEMLMMDGAKKNPKFAEELSKLALFPLFYTQEMAIMSQPEAQGMPGQPVGAPIQAMPELPVNPLVGGEPQLPQNPPMPTVEQQLGVEGPVAPTSGI